MIEHHPHVAKSICRGLTSEGYAVRMLQPATFTDIFNNFALQHDIIGNGFTTVYQNFLETQVATLVLRVRF